MLDSEVGEILNRRMPNSIVSWITILIIFIVVSLILINTPFNTYKSFNGYIFEDNNNFYIKVLVDKSDFPINNKNTLYIKDKKYKYKVINIDKDEYILDLKLDNNIKIDNNIVIVNIKKEKTTVFKILKNKLKKGLI